MTIAHRLAEMQSILPSKKAISPRSLSRWVAQAWCSAPCSTLQSAAARSLTPTVHPRVGSRGFSGAGRWSVQAVCSLLRISERARKLAAGTITAALVVFAGSAQAAGKRGEIIQTDALGMSLVTRDLDHH